MEDSCVLIVDDEKFLLELASSFFKSEGMEVHCASSGEEALRKLGERAFILMVTDFNMPEMDGLELAAKAREMAPRMPILLVTGDYSPEISSLAREAGIAKVFAKPFDFEELLALVRRELENT